jgi:hypothetical protein
MLTTEYFRGQEKALLAHAKAAGLLRSGSEDPGDRARGRLLNTFLKDHLAGRLAVVTGEIFDSTGASSGELDNIIADTGSPALVVGDASTVPVEAAVAACVTRRSLGGHNLRNALEEVAKIKSLTRTRHHGVHRTEFTHRPRIAIPPRAPAAHIVAFRSPKLPHVLQRIADNPEWYKNDFIKYGPDTIVVLGRGMAYKNDQHIFIAPDGGEGWQVAMSKDVSGLQKLLGHTAETLARYGGLSYEVIGYF